MKRILIPTDFSKNAEVAVKFAQHIASKFEADLYLVNTFNVNVGHYGFFDHLEEKVKESSLNGLEDTKKVILNSGFPEDKLHCFSQHGELSDIARRMEKEFKFDLIVMGTKGVSGFDEVLIGSKTADLVSATKAPVLVVPEHVSDFDFKRVTYAADFKRIGNHDDLSALYNLVKKDGGKIDLLRILNPEDDRASLSKDFDEVGVKYDQWLADIPHEFFYEENEKVEEGIENFIQHEKPNALAVFARKNGILRYLFHKSISKRLTFHTSIPLLVLKER